MADFDLDVEITEEMQAIRESCHRYAEEVLRPVGAKLDRMTPEEVIADNSPLWDALKKYQALGLEGMPDSYGPDLTPAQRALTHSIVLEELCWGDVGMFITFALYNMAPSIARNFGRDDLAEFFKARNEICCLALTEPNHGSDICAFTEPAYFNPEIKADCRVRKTEHHYILNGQKAAWVSTGTIAGCSILFATNEESKSGLADGVVFLMPLDLPGVSRGKPLDKVGQRTLNQGEIFFDNVSVDKKFVLMEGPDIYPMVWEFTLRGANIAMGQQFIGVARAAFDHALAYAKARVQGGVPIIQHQNVKNRLFNMWLKLETARSHVRRVAVAEAVAGQMGVPFQHAAAAKIISTQTAFEVASEAIQIFGGNGLCREYPVEKLFRDARASMIEDGENSMLGLMAATRF